MAGPTAGLLVLMLGGIAANRLFRPADPLPSLPRVMLWAWERPEDLRFIRPGTAGIAFLAGTVWLDGERVVARPRLQPLRFNPGTPLAAVVRLESAGRSLPEQQPVVREILHAAALPGIRSLQIDFDARQSERFWYAALLRQLRTRLAPALHFPGAPNSGLGSKPSG
jgi:hypothetical protein